MFARPARGLLDFLVALLCVWGAYYHTPAGALLRRATAWTTDTRTTARPLLAYYGGASSDVSVWSERRVGGPVVPRGDLPLRMALAYGALESLAGLPRAERAAAYETARRYQIDPALLEDDRRGAEQMARLLDHLRTDLGSDEAAVLALLCGYEPARYAKERAAAEGGVVGMEEIARQLPPDFEARVAKAAQAITLSTAYALSWPVPERLPVTSPFGARNHPLLGGRRHHTGVDIGMPVGTAVKASAHAVVRRASEDSVNGKVLVLDHGNGVTTAYCHNSQLLVATGQRVERGAVIARSGNSGRSTGPHLHYQLELADHPVDPLRFRAPRPISVPPDATASEGRTGRIVSARPEVKVGTQGSPRPKRAIPPAAAQVPDRAVRRDGPVGGSR
ncbi:MAG: M23 family metallopeptidase [Myxococcota bacterium]|nr:M23 family metallopeptidase [Myxococcota bacterium]